MQIDSDSFLSRVRDMNATDGKPPLRVRPVRYVCMTRLDAGFDRALDDLDLRTVTRSPVLEYLGRLLDECRELDEGEVATYIPELGRADPRWFGICP